MRSSSVIVSVCALGAAAACSLTTSLGGFSSGDPTLPVMDGGGARETGVDGGTDADTDADAGEQGYRTVVLADAPLAYWRLGDTGTVAKDEVGAHPGTYVGVVSHAQGAIAGSTDTAAVFDGTNYIEVENAPGFEGKAPFTIEAWASPVAGASDPMCIAAKTFAPGGASGGVADGYTLYLGVPTNATHLARFKSSVGETVSGTTLNNGSFSHIVATYDGATLVMHVNWKHVGDAPSTSAITSVSRNLTLGAGRGGIYCYFRGALDEIAIYDKALSLAQVRAHYQAGVSK